MIGLQLVAAAMTGFLLFCLTSAAVSYRREQAQEKARRAAARQERIDWDRHVADVIALTAVAR